MTTDAPLVKELYIPDIPDEFPEPVETPVTQPEEEPARVPS
jgi:hypothetical protein